jgi:RpiB/LacA/LacB family sugar-phosphate isomerase
VRTRGDFDVQSAGFRTEGRPADRRAQDHVGRYGGTLQNHRTRIVDRDLLADSELIVALAGQHVREVAAFDRTLLARTFTLKDLVRRAAAMPLAPGEAMVEWFERMAATRTRADLLKEGATLDVIDPAGSSKRVFERVAAEVDELVDRLVPALAEAAARRSTVPPDPPAPATVASASALAVVGDPAGSRLAELIHEYLRESGYVLLDLATARGAHPAEAVGRAVAAGDAAAGVCVCATGNASAMAVNLIDGARAAVAHDVTSARLARRSVGANVLCLGSRLVSASTAFDAVSAFLVTSPPQPA